MSEILVPSPNNGYAMPFFYSAIRSCWAFYAVDKSVADAMLADGTGGDTGMEATTFSSDGGETALACLNFMHYPAYGNTYGSFTTELEVNIVGHPRSKAASIPALSVRQFLYGDEQTKLVGYYRMHVVADNATAIEAGRSVFGEYKYFGAFAFDIPTFNLPLDQSSSSGMRDWSFSPNVDGGKPKKPPTGDPSFTLELKLSNLQPDFAASQNCVTDYSMWSKFTAGQVNPDDNPEPPIGTELNGSRRNYLGSFTTYMLDASDAANVVLTYGPDDKTDFGLTADMHRLLDDATPVAAAEIRSEPAVIESPAYFVNRI